MSSFHGLSGSVRNGARGKIDYPDDGRKLRKAPSYNGDRSRKNAKLLREICPNCHIAIAIEDPNGESVPGTNGKERKHKICPKLF